MYKKNQLQKGSLRVNEGYEGETIEKKVARITNNREPISDGAPLVYTDRSEGVLPGYNIKTDRWDVAIDAMDTVTKAHQAKREERAKAKMEALKGGKNEDNSGGATSTADTK